jgi:hypothetical protein
MKQIGKEFVILQKYNLRILYAEHMEFTALRVLNARNGQRKKKTQLITHIITALFAS